MEPLAWYRVVVQVVVCGGLLLLTMLRPIPRFQFAVLGMAGAVGYGVLQDQISARLCPEYFTVFHPPIPGLTDPTLLGIAWGFLGTWWCGAILGYAVGSAATLGRRPPLAPKELVRPMLLLLGAVATAAALTGWSTWRHAELFDMSLGPFPASVLPPIRHRELLTVACYHFVAYGAAILGGCVLCIWVVSERLKRGGL